MPDSGKRKKPVKLIGFWDETDKISRGPEKGQAANPASCHLLGAVAMHSIFHTSLWQIAVARPWRAKQVEECVEITQPEGIGALHISGAIKQSGTVLDSETQTQLQQDCPDDTDFEPARFGGFIGYGAEYVDWNTSTFWKKWIIASGRVLLFITYNCKHGDEDLELPQACQILSSLELRE